MADLIVTCACGREMAPVASLGPGNYRCPGCRTRVKVNSPALARATGHCIWPSRNRCTGKPYKDLPVCRAHSKVVAGTVLREPRARREMADFEGIELYKRQVALSTARESREVELERARAAVEFRATGSTTHDGPSVVYYARLRGDQIKIGTTMWLRTRMSDLRIQSLDDVLAAEPGGRMVEKERHKQFTHLRLRGRYGAFVEEFREADDLMAHIAAIRERFGDPHELAERIQAEAESPEQGEAC